MKSGYFTLILDEAGYAEKVSFDEVILYFNVVLKQEMQVLEEMDRFAAEVAPAFA